MRSLHRTLALSFLVLALSGCQVIWASITSPSDWVSGSSTSISGSFEGSLVSSGSGGGDKTAYRGDVRVLTVVSAGEGALDDAFLRDLGGVATRHAINRWEDEPATFVSIGAGLREAGWSQGEVGSALATLGTGPERDALVRAGYEGGAIE